MTALLGYVGPGAGLGFLGSLLAVVAVVAVGLLGLVIYPLKRVLAWYSRFRSPLREPRLANARFGCQHWRCVVKSKPDVPPCQRRKP